MPLFCVKAMDQNGQNFKKELWADSLDSLKESLVRDGIWFESIEEKKESSTYSLNLNEKIAFFQDLYQLLRAGIVLFEAIDLIETKMQGQKGHPIFLGIKESLKRGQSFSKSMADSGGSFDMVTIGMIKTAETSGQITSTVRSILDILKKNQQLKKEIIQAVSYPLFLLVLAVVVLIVLLLFLVPSLKDLFLEQNLPWLTRTIIKTSDFIVNSWMLLAIGFTGIGYSIYVLMKQQRVRIWMYRAILRLPVLSEFFLNVLMARFSRTLHGLVLANVPLVEGLKLSKGVMQNPLFCQTIDEALANIHQGKTISQSFQNTSMVSPLFCRMLETAEKSGELCPILDQAGELYDQNVQTTLKRMVGVLQPFLIIFIGLIVGLIMIGTLLPMTDIRSFMEAT
jgi:type II secretory pathway component PulF